ncbi:MAG TPA: flavodoxin domain-containing protein [Phototrophicaceae bacterium]|nr:flavodoxin domain-containing protein [Phototrophicaceae bacterium]
MKILVAYATAHGSTAEVAQFIGRVLSTYNAEVTVANVADIQNVKGYDAYVLGSAIHAGLWLQEMCIFTDRFADALAQKPSYFWVSCIRALEDNGRKHALKYYFDNKLLESFDLRKQGVFAGKLNVNEITRHEQWFLVANYDGKLTTGNINQDYRDWKAIAAWTNSVANDLELVPVFDAVKSATA